MKAWMRALHLWAVVAVSLMVSACGSVSAVGYPDGSGSYIVMRTMTAPSAFAATQQRNFMEKCTTKTHDDYIGCTLIVVPDARHVSAPGYVAGPLQYALPSAAGAYAGYAIGQGLKNSGDTVNNGSSSAAGASANAESNAVNKPRIQNNNESFNGKGYQW